MEYILLFALVASVMFDSYCLTRVLVKLLEDYETRKSSKLDWIISIGIGVKVILDLAAFGVLNFGIDEVLPNLFL